MIRIKNEFGVTEGQYGINKMTVEPPKGYTLTSDGTYLNKDGQPVGGSYTSKGNLHASPFYASHPNVVDFRFVTGHELVHAYHRYMFGDNYNRNHSEIMARNYSGDTLQKAGRYIQANAYYDSANKLITQHGTPPGKYALPLWILLGTRYKI